MGGAGSGGREGEGEISGEMKKRPNFNNPDVIVIGNAIYLFV